MVIAVASQEPYVYMMRAEDLICNLGANNPSIETVEIFNPHVSKVHHSVGDIRLKTCPSQRSQRRGVKAINPPDRPVDGHQPIIGTKRGLGMRLRNIGGSSGFRDTVESDLSHPRSTQHRRKRSVRSLFSGIFSNKVEEIIDSARSEAIDTQTAADTMRNCASRNNIPNYRHQQAMHTLFGKKTRMHNPLEPIPETSVFGLGTTEAAVKPEYIFFQSAPCVPMSGFRHGSIRLRKPERQLQQSPREKAGLDYADYETALRETADHWLSGNYESQQEKEQEADEIEDLLDWCESWGIGDAGTLIADNVDRPLTPSSIACESLPDISYSDTGSEDSISSYQIWTGHREMDTQRLPSEWTSDYEEDMKRIPIKKLSEDSIGSLTSKATEGLIRCKSLVNEKGALCEYHYVHGITV